MAKVEIYIKSWCPYCVGALRLLSDKGVAFRAIEISGDLALTREMETRSGRRTVPQVFIDDAGVGGFDDLMRLERAGLLDTLLAREP